MTENYRINYSADALGDLREIYNYIANELLAPENAAAQVKRIRKKARSLTSMPERYVLVEWEPWHSMEVHKLPVDNFIIYYQVKAKENVVNVVRVFYGGRDIENIVKGTTGLD
ncbi:MAG: type II toxin-antitoxin system RelE/ParE family toxin [Lachnospiraceae bacterium]|nr:type II toxin-antitoxin system RelE/ParE family toxin [Lachnospiraceae bacterium]